MWILYHRGSPLSWKSKKQNTVALSSAEAEYRLLRRITTEIAWLTRLLHELGLEDIEPVALRCDNRAAIYIAKNPVFYERTKHIDLDCHYVREKLQQGLICVNHIPAHQQLVDPMTKILPGKQYLTLFPGFSLQKFDDYQTKSNPGL